MHSPLEFHQNNNTMRFFFIAASACLLWLGVVPGVQWINAEPVSKIVWFNEPYVGLDSFSEFHANRYLATDARMIVLFTSTPVANDGRRPKLTYQEEKTDFIFTHYVKKCFIAEIIEYTVLLFTTDFSLVYIEHIYETKSYWVCQWKFPLPFRVHSVWEFSQ